MTRLLLKISLGLGLALAAWIFAGKLGVDTIASRAADLNGQSMSRLGVSIDSLVLGDSKFEFPSTAVLSDISARVDLNERSAIARKAGFSVSIGRVEVSPSSVFLDEWMVSVSDIDCRSLYVEYPVDGPKIGQLWLKIAHLEKATELSLTNLNESIHGEYQGLVELMRIGQLAESLDLKGSFGFNLDDSPVVVNFHSEARLGGVGLRADIGDIRSLSNLYSLALTEAELEVVSKYPLQSPVMFRLHLYATNAAKSAHNQNSSVPEDAYRHLLWSFLLADKFGVDLAKEITDAHEVGSTTNTEADHRMDYHNNELGRKYALEGRRESEILGLSRSDPKVIRAPQ